MNADWQPLLAIDSDKWAAQTYAANFPDVRVECATVADCIDSLPYADVILGSPPCQPHSVAGKQKASTDARDGGADFVAAIEKVRPRMFLGENVRGILSSEGGVYLDNLFQAMRAAGSGYVVSYKLLDAVNFGVPQFRKRVFFWGIRCDLYADGIRHCWPYRTHQWPPDNGSGFFPLLPGVTVGEALGLSEIGARQSRGPKWQDSVREWTTAEPSPTVMTGSGIWLQSHADPAQSIDLPSPTVVAQWHKGLPDGALAVAENWRRKGDLWCRRMTVPECLRMQSGPDNFQWPDKIGKTHQYRIIGNGIASGMAAAMSHALALADPKSRTVISLFCGGGIGDVGWHGRYWRIGR